MTDLLAMSLLGGVTLKLGEQPLTGLASRRTEALLIYLACTGRSHTREALANLLWDNRSQSQALGNLRVVLTSLRQTLGPYVTITRQTVAFNQDSPHWLDVVELEAGLAAARGQRTPGDPLSPQALARLARTLSLYRGDFLPGFYLHGCRDFEEWQVTERERLRLQTIEALHDLVAGYLAGGNYLAGLEQTRRLLQLDPLREETHRSLMLLLAYSGQRNAALAQYETCCRILADELDVEPMAETTALYEQIKAGELNGEAAGQVETGPSSPGRDWQVIYRLPPQATPFVGRNNELIEIADLLARPACRLLTLVGPGGIGKTTLALEAARTHLAAYPDGVVFVPLASSSSEDYLVSALADALQITFYGQDDPKAQIINYLKARHLLLVMDSLEYLRHGAGFLSDLLRNTKVEILATSLERLNLREEWIYEVRGLSLPEPGALATDGSLDVEAYSAVQLFVQGAQRVDRAFSLAADERQAVIHICELVDGLPLGIELAAAWVRVLSCQEIAREIERNLDFLATTWQNVPEGHRSLRAVFDHSWKLLSVEQREVMRRLAVFHGGFSREAAEEIAGASLPMLAGLADKSLLHLKEVGRFEMHPVLRQYAAERLKVEPSEAKRLQDLHAAYYAAFLQQREARLVRDRDKTAFEEVRAEMDNLRAAWDWAVRQSNDQEIRQLAHGLYALFCVRGGYQEGVQTFQNAITVLSGELGGEASRKDEKERTLGVVLNFQGALYRYLGQFETARELLEESLSILRRCEAKRELRGPLLYLALIANAQGQDDEARELLNEGLAISRGIGDPYKISARLAILGDIAFRQGEYEEAKQRYQEALSSSREAGAQTGIARSFTRLGIVSEAMGDYAEARQFLQRSLEISSKIGDPREMAKCLAPLGRVAAAQGNFEEARNLYLEAIGIAMEIGSTPLALNALVGMADLLRHKGEIEFAIELLALVIHHPASERDTEVRAEQLLAASASELPPEKARAAREIGASASLEEIVAAILGQKEQPAEARRLRRETMKRFVHNF
jgi:predicted ATPase/DNA-binding SARP family transcriptional activator